MRSKAKSRVSNSRQKRKTTSVKKVFSEKSTTIEKSFNTVKSMPIFLLQKYFSVHSDRQYKFLIQTYTLNRHTKTTQLRLRSSDNQFIQDYYDNPQPEIKQKITNQAGQVNRFWLMLPLTANVKVDQVMTKYRRDKLRNIEKHNNKACMIKGQKWKTPKAVYDTSQTSLKTLISKIQNMVDNKNSSDFLHLLDELDDKIKNKQNQYFFNIRDTMEHFKRKKEKENCPIKKCSATQPYLLNVIHEYGIEKTKQKKHRKKRQKKNGKQTVNNSISKQKFSKSISQGKRDSKSIMLRPILSRCNESQKNITRYHSPFQRAATKKKKVELFK